MGLFYFWGPLEVVACLLVPSRFETLPKGGVPFTLIGKRQRFSLALSGGGIRAAAFQLGPNVSAAGSLLGSKPFPPCMSIFTHIYPANVGIYH